MSLIQDIPQIIKTFKEMQGTLEANRVLMDIQEGNLLEYVEKEMREQLSPSAFEICKKRVPSINIQKKVIDKLSQIYEKPPTRAFGEGATATDLAQWDQYKEAFNIDVSGQLLNEYFNLMKSCAWEPYLDQEFQPKLRELPKDRFFVMGNDPTDPLKVTHLVKVMGQISEMVNDALKVKTILYVYSAQEFLIIYDNGEVATPLMAQKGLDGSNPFGVIPFVYLNRSKVAINSKTDDDLYRMVTLIPILFADVNYALMFQAFSIWYGVNVDVDNIPINPNTFIRIKGDVNNPGADPKIGVIKPEVDSDKVITCIMEQLSLWLQSRGIRPGTIGKASPESSLSGLSKMVDEMDTTAERKKQIPYFVDAEKQLQNLVCNKLHLEWIKNPSFPMKAAFTPKLQYSVKFAEQISWQTRMEILNEIEKELKLRLISRESAYKKLNPDANEKQMEEELGLIEEDNEEEDQQNGPTIPPVQT